MPRQQNERQQEATPVPYAKISVLGLVLTSNNCGIWIIYTMLPFMVKFYFPHMSLKELGFRAGILGSAFSVGSLFGNFLWGIVADRYGRKPALVCGLFGTVIASLMFGFSPNFWVAVLARFLWGFLNGNIGVSKTYMAEITDDSNNAKGMSLYGVIGGFGRTVGPVIGGFLIEPAVNYPNTFAGTVFEDYPFALPVTIVAAQCLITVCLAIRFLPETLRGSYFYKENEDGMDSTEYGPLHTSEHAADDESRHGKPSSPLTLPSSPAATAKKKRDTKRGEEHASEARLRMEAILSEQREEGQAKRQSDAVVASEVGTANGGRRPKRKKSVGFANIVMVKTIGSDSMGFGPLKRVMDDDVPVEEVKSAGSGISAQPPSPSTPVAMTMPLAIDADDLSGLEQGQGERKAENGVYGDDSGEYKGPLEDHPELTPIKGFSLGAGKHRESPETGSGEGSPSAASEDKDDATLPMLPLRQDVRAPRNKLVFSNGAEFFSQGGAARGRHDVAADEEYDAASGSDISRGAQGYIAMVSYLLSRRQILLSTFMYGLNGFITIMAAEIFPLWVVTKKEDGGFGFTAQMIGLCTMITGPISIVGQLVLYPGMVERQGLIGTYKFSAHLFAITVVLMPMISLTNSLEAPIFTTTLVVIALAIINTSQMWVLISVFSFINNSCYSYQRATVNSIGQTFAAMGRLMGPYLGGVIFAWSETNGLSWPLNYVFTFYLVGGVAYLSGGLASLFPRSIQRRKREPKKLRYAQPGLGGGLTDDELLDDSQGAEGELEMQPLNSPATSSTTPKPGLITPGGEQSPVGSPAPSLVHSTSVPASERAWRRSGGGANTAVPGSITVGTASNPMNDRHIPPA